MIKRLLEGDERGAASIVVGVAMTALIGFSALAIDAGIFYHAHTRLESGVDAAALAGAQELSSGALAASAAALEYAERNGLAAEDLTVQIAPGNQSIHVTGRCRVPLFFGRLLWPADRLQLEKSATAVAGCVTGVQGAVPLGIKNQPFNYGERYVLKVGGGQDHDLGSGNFGALAFAGGGASRYEEHLTNGYQGLLSIGDIVPTEPGNMSNPTKRAIDKRIDRSQSESPEDIPKGDPRVLIVPVFEPYLVKNNKVVKVQIVSFAAFWVERVAGQGNESQITGYFIEMLTSGEISGGAPYKGLKAVKLSA